jgi:hypothetical protein
MNRLCESPIWQDRCSAATNMHKEHREQMLVMRLNSLFARKNHKLEENSDTGPAVA